MKTILISGGSDGLGRAIAAQLAPNNNVIILSPHEDKLRKVAEEISCKYQICDVRDYAQVEKTVAEVGPVDCVINNAGLWIEGPVDELDPVRIHEVLEVNTLGTINLTKAVLPGMKQRKTGRIININSQAGLYAKAERGVYNASKWAVTGFTKSLQEELAPFGIGVTGIYPGKLNTELFAKAGTPKSMENAIEPAVVAKTIEFILGMDDTILFTEVGVKHLEG